MISIRMWVSFTAAAALLRFGAYNCSRARNNKNLTAPQRPVVHYRVHFYACAHQPHSTHTMCALTVEARSA